ncbi:hypothetical protein SEETMRM9437_1780 [Salmonella enterica subsp. enterica serovar Typhimurium]|nr:hypothetical protein SEETMRM9437_1780 [Salmonella enterica subsp. enterica serovar Typhimurium]APQ79227.1 hypothetical protein SEETMRM10961_1780 [Salmonella enterica subsp. enterica serovar Typhimurium]AQU50809.1 hypothetical protein SEETMRM10607_1905 [Salmonella enterica subsp. enterica serovar Typhimurium]EFX50079.1 hypothetical protein SEE_01905 [Salmonella enterica subsp. enterica serovar Typhimurium str. TN061786]
MLTVYMCLRFRLKLSNTLMTEVQTQNSTARMLTSTCQRKQ